MNLQKIKTTQPLLKKITGICIASTLIVSALQPLGLGNLAPSINVATAATTPKLSVPAWVNIKQEPLTAGAYLRNYVWSSIRANKEIHTDVSVVEVDLQNAYVRLDVMTGVNNQTTIKDSVRDMANSTGAVAGTNGDFFNTQSENVPMGADIAQGVLMTSPQLETPGYYNFAITADNKPVVDMFSFQGQVQTADGAVFPINGVNKSYYWTESPTVHHSHDNSIFVYTNAWGKTGRAVDRNANLKEVLVQNNVIQQIADKGALPIIAPVDGYILRTEGTAAQFVRDHMHVGDPITSTYGIIPQDPTKTYDTSKFKMMIGGQTILVDNGKPSAYSRTSAEIGGYRSRTGIGYSQDQRYAYLITAEASNDSAGASIAEFQQIMVAAGVWKGMNLDGGGSTQLVARPLGSTTVSMVNQTENSYERPVVNGVGVYSSAPKGSLKGLVFTGSNAVFLNEPVTFTLKGYDEYYNPIEVPADTKWTDASGIGTFEGNIFKAKKTGTATVKATVGGISQTLKVQVIGREDIASLSLVPATPFLSEDATIPLTIKVTTKSGVSRTISAAGLPMEISGFKGEINGDKLHVTSLDGSTMGQIVVHYDGFSSMLTLPIGTSTLWADFEKVNPTLSYEAYPVGVTGAVYNINNEIHLQYDFTGGGASNKASYAVFGDPEKGTPVKGEPQKLSLRLYGDNSLNMLRTEAFDKNGKLQRIDIVKSINWTGWKTVEVDLSSLNLVYPISIQHIYVASPALGQDERATTGEIYFDDVIFSYKTALPQLAKNQVKLTINKRTITVNGTSKTIDQAPLNIDGNTLVPVRFVIEQLGGAIKWDPKEEKVSILRGNQLIDFWIGKKDFIMSGTAATSLAAPQIINGRTMVPLRVLSEKLGWTVTWNDKTKSITLE
ncbi:copper amine oxidase [Paenibacillus psychroresistens]|uniref:Copper amine oxidase n=1 Tax=Paenibacillus psychroresistens TaxID=1778678 RepID=A0A6B8R9S6_9BACL|nr:stalk domain-containing protein [Paenibacillus psychroresistens]QGQ93509.1 copper amine oxidase [Paenibacillus psychroresistens]